MSMLTYMIMATLFCVIVFLATAALQSSRIRISRDLTMNGAPEDIFAQINNFHKWPGWSPWARIDRRSTMKFEGPREGEGAAARWKGNSHVGKGSMIITDSDRNDHVTIRTEIERPLHALESMEFQLEPIGDKTHVVWTMDGKINFTERIVGMFMDYDKTIGNEFVKGLASIKDIVERRKVV